MNTLITITGPTGAGKTDIAVKIALELNCEIISADSRQFYRDIPIGTATPDAETLRQVRHHFVGFLPIESYYSASMFERDVIRLLPSLFRSNFCALMVGGSGLYINAVCDGIDDIPDVKPEIREAYTEKLRLEGIASLRRELRMVDLEHYNKVDLKNPRRIMRALEIYRSTGMPYSSFLNKEKYPREFNCLKIGISPERTKLYARINSRVDKMIADGLEEEAKAIYPFREANSLQTVGYRELFQWFDGCISREKAIELIKRNSRRYARRQMTWWARDKTIKWFLPSETDELLNYIKCETGKTP